MFNVNATFTVEGKAPVVHEWAGLEKVHAVDHLEKKLNDFMQKMNGLASSIIHGKAPKPTTRTNPATLVLDCSVWEDGNLWARATYTYPNMSEEMQAVFIGTFDGEMAKLDHSVKDKKAHK